MLAAKVPCRYLANDMKSFYRITIADLGILLCIVASLFLPAFWEWISSRDYRPNATNAGILIFIFAVILRLGGYRWPVKVLVLSIIPVLVLSLLCIAYFSGYTGSDLFDMFKCRMARLFEPVHGPSLAGIAVASIALNRKNNS